MRRAVQVLAVGAVLGLVGCGPAVDDGTGDVGQIDGEAKAVNPTGKGIGTLLGASGGRDKSRIAYHNGAVLTGIQNLYYIWYGDWSSGAATQDVLNAFGATIGNTPYLQINGRYTNAAGQPASSTVVYASQAFDNSYAHGASLSDADITAIIADQITSFRLPQDSQGIYVVFTSADVTATSGFCTQYCGQHNSAVIAGGTLRYIFVCNSNRCAASCSPQSVSPNGDAAGDAMAGTLAGELSDTLTDPSLSAWYDRDGLDDGDKCAWTYGSTFTTSNGAQANIQIGSRSYLLPQNFWPTNRGGVCVMNQTQAAAAVAAGLDLLPN